MDDKKEERGTKKRDKVKELFAIRQLTINELISITFYIVVASLSGARGFTFMTMKQEEILSSDMYMSLVQYASAEVWGGAIVFLSIALVFSVLLAREPNYLFTAIINSLLAIIFILLSGAAYENGTSILNFYNHTIISGAHVILAGLGVMALCQKRRNINT